MWWLLFACPEPTVVAPEAEVVIAVAGPDQETPVGVELVFDGTGSVGERLTWSFGDPADPSEAEGARARHTWSRPGHYTVVLTVTGAGGLTRTDTAEVTVYRPAAAVLPRASSAIAVDPARQEAWVAVPDADAVTVVDLEAHTAAVLAVCDGPRQVAVEGDEVAITCDGSDEVVILATASRSEVRRWRLPEAAHPWGVVGRDGAWWVTGAAQGELIELDGRDLLRTPIGDDPRAIALGPDGWFVTRFRSAPYGGEVYAGDEAATRTLALDPATGVDTDTQIRGVPTGLRAIALSPDGGTLYVGGHIANTGRGPLADGAPTDPLRAVRASVHTFDAATGAPTGEHQLDASEVSTLTLSPRGDHLWVAHPGVGVIERLDAYTLERTGEVRGAGQGVDALAFAPDGSLLVLASLDRALRAFDVSGPVAALRWSAPIVESEPLSPGVLRGKQLFHTAADPRLSAGQLACATCHPDGEQDGLTWDLAATGEGLRNTISLLGQGGVAHGPLGWTGNADEVQDVERFIRRVQGGSGLVPDDAWLDDPLGAPTAGLSTDLDALAAYVASLTAPARSPWRTLGEGEALFQEKSCFVCHDPATDYTDSALNRTRRHDVGTATPESGSRLGGAIDGFDTPSLLGAWASPPYLHDGSAPSLESAIGAHDIAVPISPQEKITLATFLRTL